MTERGARMKNHPSEERDNPRPVTKIYFYPIFELTNKIKIKLRIQE